jgi:hypothetical protein
MLRPLDRADFEALVSLVPALHQLQRRCRPFGADYDALAVALTGLSEAAEAVTGERASTGPGIWSGGGLRGFRT